MVSLSRHVRMAPTLRIIASAVLILPSCLLACALIGLQLLASVLWPALVWPAMVAIAWLPVVIAGLVIVAIAGILLLARFPALLPLLLLAVGLASTVTLFVAAPLWMQNDDVGAWSIMTFGLIGSTLAGWQFRAAMRL